MWRVTAAGGAATQMTDNGGAHPLEAPDGKTLYYRKTEAPSVLFARPVAGGPERRALESMVSGIHQYLPMADGIYYIALPDRNSRLRAS